MVLLYVMRLKSSENGVAITQVSIHVAASDKASQHQTLISQKIAYRKVVLEIR